MIDTSHGTRPAHRRTIGETVGIWMEVSRGRRQLARMNRVQLRDIGLTPGEAAREAGRPFWDIGAR